MLVQKTMMDVNRLRATIPMLQTTVDGKPLVYVDNAATTHKPQQVIDAISTFYAHEYASVGRGLYTIAERATERYEQARATIARFLNARDASEIVFTHGTTDSINMLATAWARTHISAGDRIVITALEHHSNLLVWQRCAALRGAELVVIPLRRDGRLAMDQAATLINERTKLVAVCHVSNALGTVVDVQELASMARVVGAKIVVDGSQSVPHGGVDVQALACDMLVFSGHKIMGPTGVGVLYARKEMHDQLLPYQFGGGMVYEATYQTAVWRDMPYRLEAGTPPIAQAIGLAAAIDFFTTHLQPAAIHAHEAALCARLIDGLMALRNVRILGPVEQLRTKSHLVSFVVDGIHAHDVAAYLNTHAICVRAGHHCAQPLAQSLGITASVRVSFYWYNTTDEVDRIVSALASLHV